MTARDTDTSKAPGGAEDGSLSDSTRVLWGAMFKSDPAVS